METTATDDQPKLSVPMGRRDRERLARRRAMLDAAVEVFAKRGYDGATLEEVAERAEFGKGTLYNYFPGGKLEIFGALFEEEVYGGLMAAIDAELGSGPKPQTPAQARTTFRGLIVALIGHFRLRQHEMALYLREFHRQAHDPALATVFVGLHDRLMTSLANPIQEAMEAGALRPLPPVAVAHLLMGNVRGYLMAESFPKCEGHIDLLPAADDAAEFITSVLFDGLLAGRSDAPSA